MTDIEQYLKEKEIAELRVKCFELAKELYRDQGIFKILIISQEIYKFIVRENDAEIDAVIADLQERKERFNLFLSH
jgi:hypothetical protein